MRLWSESLRLLNRCYRFIVSQELMILLLPMLIVAGVWAFVEITDDVMEGDTQRIDERVIESLRSPENPLEPVGPEWLQEAALEITALGSIAVLSITTLLVFGYLGLSRRWRHNLFLLTVVIGGAALSLLLKDWIGRERPSVVPHLVDVHTKSFPSGHAMLSAVVWLTLGAMLAELEARRSLRSYIYGAAMTIAILVGITRVYLGVHYPTDVLAGWTAGLVWALGVGWSARILRRRRVIEAEDSRLPEPASSDEAPPPPPA